MNYKRYSSKQLEKLLLKDNIDNKDKLDIMSILDSRGIKIPEKNAPTKGDFVKFKPAKNGKHANYEFLTGTITSIMNGNDGKKYARIQVKDKGYMYKQINKVELCKE